MPDLAEQICRRATGTSRDGHTLVKLYTAEAQQSLLYHGYTNPVPPCVQADAP